MTPIRTRRPLDQTPEDHSLAVSQDTYSLITDVLAGKILTALTFHRSHAAVETAAELFTLLDQGVSAKSINLQYLALQIFDIYRAGDHDMAKIGRDYLEKLSKYDVSYASLDAARLREAVEQVRRESKNTLCVLGADDFYQWMMAHAMQNRQNR